MTVRDFLLPDLGEGLEDAEVVQWMVKEGDRVELNQTLVEVNTAKAAVEIPSPWAGVIERLHAAEGDLVKVGLPLVSIRVAADDAGGDAPAEAPPEGGPKRRAVLVGYGVEEEEPVLSLSAPASAPGRSGPVPASPPVRRLAKELGVDLGAVNGTGPDGRITREDVLAAVASAGGAEELRPPPTAADDVRRIPVRGTRRLIAEKMARAAREIPHVTTFLTVDATWLQAFRQEVANESGRRMGPLAIIVRALADTTPAHPTLLGSFDAERSEILIHSRCNVGIATDTERGLMVPVIRDADRKGLLDLAEEIARLSEASRDGSIGPADLAGGTITVTNVGTFGAEFGTPIINHPQGAILAVGVLEPRALVVDGRVEARPAVTLSLTFDHRLMDGAEAGRALREVADRLESPEALAALPR